MGRWGGGRHTWGRFGDRPSTLPPPPILGPHAQSMGPPLSAVTRKKHNCERLSFQISLGGEAWARKGLGAQGSRALLGPERTLQPCLTPTFPGRRWRLRGAESHTQHCPAPARGKPMGPQNPCLQWILYKDPGTREGKDGRWGWRSGGDHSHQLTSCVTLGKSPGLPVPQFPHL